MNDILGYHPFVWMFCWLLLLSAMLAVRIFQGLGPKSAIEQGNARRFRWNIVFAVTLLLHGAISFSLQSLGAASWECASFGAFGVLLAMPVVFRLPAFHAPRLVRLLGPVGVSCIAPTLMWTIVEVNNTLNETDFDQIALTDVTGEVFLGSSFSDVRPTPLATDRGMPIRAKSFDPEVESTALQLYIQQKRITDREFLQGKLIRTAEAWQDSSNCHGYVFTGGRYWIPGDEVPKILRDNRYYSVVKARVNDVAIYRAQSGSVLHTAVVRTIVNDDLILVESKWGALGRFIHPHDAHCYGDCVVTFYRSPRKGHVLHSMPSTVAETYPTAELLRQIDEWSSVAGLFPKNTRAVSFSE